MKHIRTELIRCKECYHEFWSKYCASGMGYISIGKEPRCGNCGSSYVELIGYRK